MQICVTNSMETGSLERMILIEKRDREGSLAVKERRGRNVENEKESLFLIVVIMSISTHQALETNLRFASKLK